MSDRGRGRQKAPRVDERLAGAHQRARERIESDGRVARDLVRRVGRPSKLTPDLIFRIGDLTLGGNYRDVAASACGISRGTLSDWLAKGEELEGMDPEQLDEGQRLLVEFAFVLRVCEANAEADLVADWRRGGTGWQAFAAMLERRFPARWKRREEVEHLGSVSTRTTLTPEQVAEELEAFGMTAALAVARGPDAVEPPEDR